MQPQLKRALGSVRVAYQPVVRLRDRVVVGYEALMRPESLEPKEALKNAKMLNLLLPLEKHVLLQIKDGAKSVGRDKTVFINLSWQALRTPRAVLPVLSAIPRRICLEMPEDWDDSWEGFEAVVRAWKQRGFCIALDDCSNSRDIEAIRRGRPDFVKVSARLPKETAKEIMHASEKADALVVLEEIESNKELKIAQALGATLGQGFLLGKPCYLDERREEPVDEDVFQDSAAHAAPGGDAGDSFRLR